ncbi:DUF4373 domain-containing protein [Dyadobacter sp. CY345]|uniref:DUF4373 domain-containing protein n=1 Tax=Dyadobacter sp. CY345 TaxID=2909335 RepID=UPI001F1D74B9|nr:DUF4373 domain-containing protein [Dyadobacter sp. CY345]MCF2443636.1 DUF4373 domain-containing protein [Dyadobacter sp. CY345]
MAKGKYYFQHDYDALNDPKIIAMRDRYGMEGYGLYWAIVEMLHATEGNKLPMKDYQFIAIAKQTEAFAKQKEANLELIKNYLTTCIDSYELFSSDGVFFWCDRVLRNMKKMADISEKRRESGRLGGLSKNGEANAKQNEANRSKIKDTKVSKRNINIVFDVFWDLYGKKVGKPKAASLWDKLTDQERSLVIERIPSYLKTLNPEDNGKFQAHPATYLNGRRWEDELQSNVAVAYDEPERPRRYLNDPDLMK